MVLASKPVASVMRLAALPVGAHSNRLTPLAARMRRIALTIVVLPTPGPPVMTSTLEVSAKRIAAAWLSARDKPVLRSIHGNALSGSIWGQGSAPWARRRSLSANHLLRPVQPREEDAALLADCVRNHGPLDQLKFQRCLHQL